LPSQESGLPTSSVSAQGPSGATNMDQVNIGAEMPTAPRKGDTRAKRAETAPSHVKEPAVNVVNGYKFVHHAEVEVSVEEKRAQLLGYTV